MLCWLLQQVDSHCKEKLKFKEVSASFTELEPLKNIWSKDVDKFSEAVSETNFQESLKKR